MGPQEKEQLLFQEKRQQKKDVELMVFRLLDLDGDKVLNIIDLMTLCAHFEKETPLGADCHLLMDKYKKENLFNTAYVTNFQYDFETYNKVITTSALSKELIYTFMEQFMNEDNTFHSLAEEDGQPPGDHGFKMKAFADELIKKKAGRQK